TPGSMLAALDPRGEVHVGEVGRVVLHATIVVDGELDDVPPNKPLQRTVRPASLRSAGRPAAERPSVGPAELVPRWTKQIPRVHALHACVPRRGVQRA
ncbi:MAG TPA: hypothetical protein VHJ99_11695, partial [Candidatus Dormibacteraeota bacterium]|nr:hypothetical protein [Candidatus Dormibacteraeota bacterium]